MSELTDLEICKRIAEIEGVHVFNDGAALLVPDYEESLRTGYDEDKEYNPLTDDALCFQLMVKYEVNVNRYYDSVTIDSDYNDKPPLANVSFATDDVSINKAICLAIIEANKLTLQKESK